MEGILIILAVWFGSVAEMQTVNRIEPHGSV